MGVKLKKLNRQFKIWKIHRDIQHHKRNVKNRRIRKVRKLANLTAKHKKTDAELGNSIAEKKFFAPEIFSIFKNSEETIDFFNRVIEFVNVNTRPMRIFIDLSEVKSVSIDAIMYLLALSKNLRRIAKTNLYFSGNIPRKESERNIFEESGFLKFMESRNRETKLNTNKVNIRTGIDVDGDTITEICKFIQDKSNVNMISTKFIYRIIGELISNAFEHAYIDAEYNQKWLIYVEKKHDYYAFTLLDTGSGIIETIQKKLKEKILTLDYGSMLSSVFYIDQKRSMTGKSYRGKWLPSLRDYVLEQKIDNMTVISNRAYVVLDKTSSEGIKEVKTMKSDLNGTIFYWEICEKELI